MKEYYQSPCFDIIFFKAEDSVTTSGFDGMDINADFLDDAG